MSSAALAPDNSQANSREDVVVESCKFCGTPVPGTYYRVDINLACTRCGKAVRHERNVVFVRALTFGVVAAIAGCAIYSTIAIVTGWNLSVISLLVGLMIGKGMMAGSHGSGERRYQVVAALLTYVAVSLATVPASLSYAVTQQVTAESEVRSVSQFTTPQVADPSMTVPSRIHPVKMNSIRIPSSLATQRPRMRLAVAIGVLALSGLASPFVVLAHSLSHGLLMLLILMIGIRIAWKTSKGNRMPRLYGPFAQEESGA
jgi:uncharacterized membrane protein